VEGSLKQQAMLTNRDCGLTDSNLLKGGSAL
jgi:hypothetical protein